MRKIILISCILIVTTFCIVIINNTIFGQNKLGVILISNSPNKEDLCFEESSRQISDSLIAIWDTVFIDLGINENGFAIMLHLIECFTEMEIENSRDYLSLQQILSRRTTNTGSSAIAVCAIMQKLGWDVLYFYNEDEIYLGVHFDKKWKIRKGSWVEKNGKKYYLKEFDNCTPVGVLKRDNPASIYRSLEVKGNNLKAIPLITNLPQFMGPVCMKELKWFYKDTAYAIQAVIPEEQIEWTNNLPPSIYGMASSGVKEMENIGLPEKLFLLLNAFDEYNKVNFIYKLSQSENIFVYDNTQPIKSISIQLVEGRNDCDGRSVVLYCLLRTVLGYSDSDIIFVSWPNHVALALKPKTTEAKKILEGTGGYCVSDEYYLLDATYTGETYWGSKMERLSGKCEIIK